MMENSLFTKNSQLEEENDLALPCCPWCGCKYTKAKDGHVYSFCLDCGKPLDIPFQPKQ